MLATDIVTAWYIWKRSVLGSFPGKSTLILEIQVHWPRFIWKNYGIYAIIDCHLKNILCHPLKWFAFNLHAFSYLLNDFVPSVQFLMAPPGWLSGKRVGLMTWRLWVQYPVEVNILSSNFSPLTSAKACEKSSWWLWKKSCVNTGMRKPGKTCTSWPPYNDLSC